MMNKPYISIILPIARPGGLDIIFRSLENQTFKDFELIIVDDLHKYRKDVIEEKSKSFSFSYKHIQSIKRTFPVQSYCHAINSGITHCDGDIILFTSDFRYLMPNDLQKRADFHKNNPANYGYSGRTILVEPPNMKISLPTYGENIQQYISDLQSNKLQEHMWSINKTDFTEDPSTLALHNPAHYGSDLKINLPYGEVNPDIVFLQADSVNRDIVLNANGLNEDLDGSHVYQDAEFTNRLSNVFGVKWIYDPFNPSYRIAGAHYIIKRLFHTRPFGSNEPIYQKYKNGSKDPVNTWSLMEVWKNNTKQI